MKKVILLFAMVFSVSMAMGQNTATTTQNGDLQESSTTQTGNLNNATVTQTQDGTPSNSPAYMNKATVVQDGTSNTATVTQDELGGGNKGGNDAIITQNGIGNVSTQTTYAPGFNAGMDVEALQVGDNNTVTQSITGGYTDDFYVEQIGNSNVATQTGTGVTTNTAKIYQDGLSNTATQTLAGSNNGYYGGIYVGERILIDQEGNNNIATQIFTGNGSSHGNSADIHQIGDDNLGMQEGDGRNLYTEFYQEGNNNDAVSLQFGEEQQVFVDQIGDNNEADVWQGVSYGPKVGNFADVNQNGFADWAFVNQQFGNNNSAVVNQAGAIGGSLRMGNNNYATVYQSGSGNQSNVTQSGYTNGINTSQQGTNSEINANQIGSMVFDPAEDQPNTWGFNNYATLTQKGGDDNEIELSQNGADNYANIVQDGSGHYGIIIQTGDANTGSIISTGSGHSGSITQTGGMNQAVITQGN